MPRAAIASLRTYSRSIGPRAARPSPPRERRGACTFPLQVAALSLRIDDFADQQRPPVTELRDERAELMTGVGHGEWQRARRHVVAGADGRELRVGQLTAIDSKLAGQARR